MKRAVQFLLYFLILLTEIKAADFRIAWISDTHVGSSTGEADLINTVRDINLLKDIDIVIISGDITQMGKDKDLLTAKIILDSLKVPYFIIPGNHDAKWSESGATTFLKLWDSDKFLIEHKGYTFIGLHQGPLMKMGDGHFTPEDVRWLEQKLSRIDKNQPLIIVSHYPLDNSIDNWFEVTDRLKLFNVQFVMVGHGHKNQNLDFEGIPGVMGRSNLRANRPIGGYNIIHMSMDSAHFYEKTPGKNELSLWNAIPLGKRDFNNEKKNYERPEFTVNKDFPAIRVRWKYESDYSITGTAAINEKYVYVGNTSGDLLCINIDNGKKIWKYKTGGPVYSSPDISSGKVYFGSCDSNIYCLGLNGRLLWKYRTGAAVIASPAISDNVMYIGSGDGIFRAINADNGRLIWQYKGTGFVETKPLIYSGMVIFGSWNTYLYALNCSDGSLAWKWSNGNNDELYSPAACIPVAAKGKVFIVAPDRYTSAIDAKSGNIVWRSNKFLVREAIGMTADSVIITRCITDTLAAIDPASPERAVKWISDLHYGYDIDPFMPVEKDETIFVGTKNGFLYAVESKTGKLKWKYRVSHVLLNTCTPITDNDVVITTTDGEIIRLSGNK